jgi:site-specific recombinase XerD
MESCAPANIFLRHYLLRGTISSKKSWVSIGRALYDYFSFLEIHELNWRSASSNEIVSVAAAYRDYCLEDCQLALSTTRHRLMYICIFYEYALQKEWIKNLPFNYEERIIKRPPGFLAHLHTSDSRSLSRDVMPKQHRLLPRFLSMQQIKMLLTTAKNVHHHMILRFGLQTGLRREEIASFPVAYIFDPDKNLRYERNIRIYLDPYDGSGMLTKGSKPRHIYISRRFLSDLYCYSIHMRGERASLSCNQYKQLFLNQQGQPYAGDGKAIERIVRNIGAQVDIKVYPHMLRHTYATHTLSSLQQSRNSIDPLIFLQHQLGHSSIHTTIVYLHLINELADNAVLTYDEELNSGPEHTK